MAISNAVQRDSFVYIYDENGHNVATIGLDSSADGDGLRGYTSSSVNIQQGSFINSYDERGNIINTVLA